MFCFYVKSWIFIYIWISSFGSGRLISNSMRSKKKVRIFFRRDVLSSPFLQGGQYGKKISFIHEYDNNLKYFNVKKNKCSKRFINLYLYEENEENDADAQCNFPTYESKWQKYWDEAKLFKTNEPESLNEIPEDSEGIGVDESTVDNNKDYLKPRRICENMNTETYTHFKNFNGNNNESYGNNEEVCEYSSLYSGSRDSNQRKSHGNGTTWNPSIKSERELKKDHDNLKKYELGDENPKYYILSMIPYPSGKGLHVGHLLGYTAVDVMARYKRLKKYNVLNPIGFDCFGIPTEIYSEKVKKTPQEVTKENVYNFKKQLKNMGFSFDYEREIITSDVEYYKWTQWIFQNMYMRNLAYVDKGYVNYCPGLNSELSNEEIRKGKSVRGEYDVYKRLRTMWKLRITEYAKRLYEDLKMVDYPEKLINLQKNWIGPREGYLIRLLVEDVNRKLSGNEERLGDKYLYGFVEDLSKCVSIESVEVPVLLENVLEYCSLDKKEEVCTLLGESLKMTNRELANEANRRKIYSGMNVVNPYNNSKVPIYITNGLINTNQQINCKINVAESGASDTNYRDYGNDMESQPVNVRDFENEGRGSRTHSMEGRGGESDWYRKYTYLNMKDWEFSRKRGWGEPIPVSIKSNTRMNGIDDDLDTIIDSGDEEGNLSYSQDEVPGEAYIKDRTMELNDDMASKKRRLSELPLVLNEKIEETMPQWAGSSWHYLRFVDPKNKYEIFNKKVASYWLPVDLYIGGVEHAVSHLLYSRFWNKFLYDIKVSPVLEPFKKIILHGVIKTIKYYLPKEVVNRLSTEVKNEINEYNMSNYRNKSINNNNCISSSHDDMDYDSDETISSTSEYNTDNISSTSKYSMDWSNDNVVNENSSTSKYNNVESSASSNLDNEVLEEELEVPARMVMKYKNKYVLKSDKSVQMKIKMKKMSKSRGNVISPERIIKSYGSDALRLHLLFLGPIDKDKVWSVESINGVYKLLKSIHKFYGQCIEKYGYYRRRRGSDGCQYGTSEGKDDDGVDELMMDREVAIKVNRFIDNVTNNLENIKLNKISEFFTFLKIMQNWHQQGKLTSRILDIFLIMLNPFAPHLTEELWYRRYMSKNSLNTNTNVHNGSSHTEDTHTGLNDPNHTHTDVNYADIMDNNRRKLSDVDRHDIDKNYKSISLEKWPNKINVL